MKAIDFFRALFISMEFLWALIIAFVYFFYMEVFVILGGLFKSNSDLWKSLYALPFAFTASIFVSSNKIRSPLDNEANRKLYDWPMYSYLITRVYISFVSSIFCCICTAIIWGASGKVDSGILGALYLLCTGITGFSAFSLFVASQKIKEILTRFA